MLVTWQSLIDRAKVYADDDHDDERSWIADDKWMLLSQVEYAMQYKRWLRQGLISPPITEAFLASNNATVSGVLAIVGVAEKKSNGVRMLIPAQINGGLQPFWKGSDETGAEATHWVARGLGDSCAVELYPADPNNTGSKYIIRYVPTVVYATNPALYVEVPFGCDERLVLGIAKRAHVKDSVRSSVIEQLIGEADMEAAFAAAAKLNGLKVKDTRRYRSGLSTPIIHRFPGTGFLQDVSFEMFFVG